MATATLYGEARKYRILANREKAPGAYHRTGGFLFAIWGIVKRIYVELCY